jgi:hypothetical protein
MPTSDRPGCERERSRAVYHGGTSVLTLKELVRNYTNLVEDAIRVMLRIKALFRAPGRSPRQERRFTGLRSAKRGWPGSTRPERERARHHFSRNSTYCSSCGRKRKRR